MVSTGTGDVGASKLTGEVLDIVTRMPMLVKSMTGVDIAKVKRDPNKPFTTCNHS